MTITYRDAASADSAACHELDQRCFPPDIAFDRETFDELCASADIGIVAEEVGEPVGMVFAEIEPERHIGLIITIDVNPDHRRRGIGAELMDQAEEKMKNMGVTAYYLHLYTPHTAAQSLYTKRGYLTVGKIPNYYGPGKEAILMVKKADKRI